MGSLVTLQALRSSFYNFTISCCSIACVMLYLVVFMSGAGRGKGWNREFQEYSLISGTGELTLIIL
jgi:hypothetical protein